MAKTVIIRLTCSGGRTGPFDISDNLGTDLGTGITKQNLIDGYTVSVDNSVTTITTEIETSMSKSKDATNEAAPYLKEVVTKLQKSFGEKETKK
jgi:hypothetical protein